MLDKLRKGAGGWFAQLLIGILVVGFAVWGVASRDIFVGFHADRLAVVGNTEISVQTFQSQYDQATRQLSQRLGQPITGEQAQMFGLPGQVLGRLVAQATLDDAAANMGLGLSNAALMSKIAADPSFASPNGQFDGNYLRQVLRSNNINEDQFVAEQRAAYIRAQLGDALLGGLVAPDIYLQAIHEYRTDTREIAYVTLTPALLGDIADPSDSDLSAYFDAHKADWKAPELRGVRYFTLSTDAVAKPDEVTDDEAKKAYDDQIAQYTKPETRQVDQIVFPNEEEANAAAEAISGGKSFTDIVTERGQKPEDVSLGDVTKDKIVDPAIADAAFGLVSGGTSGVIKGRFGPVIIHVGTITPGVVTPFDDVKAAIKANIAATKASAEIADTHDAIEDARAGGQTLTEIADKYGLKLVAVPTVDSTGHDGDGKEVAALPGGDFLSEVFKSEVGIENEPVQLDRNSYVWYEITAVTPSRDRTLDEVRDKVVTAWKKDETEKRLQAKAQEIHDRLIKGEDLAKIAEEMSLTVKTADQITRASKPTDDLSAAALQEAFVGPKGHVGIAAGAAEGTKTVVVVLSSEAPAYFAGTPDLAQAGDQLGQQLSNDLLNLFVAEQRERLGMTVNQAALQQAINAQPGG